MSEPKSKADGLEALARIVAARRANGGAGHRDTEVTLAQRINRAWTQESRAAGCASSSAHPLEYDKRGFPIAQRPVPNSATRPMNGPAV
jgi:hypothetical protein